MPKITLSVLAERIQNLTEAFGELKEQLNPKAELWNRSATDVDWLKRFFWIGVGALVSSWICILGIAAKVFFIG
jgi:hypothetical protein